MLYKSGRWCAPDFADPPDPHMTNSPHGMFS